MFVLKELWFKNFRSYKDFHLKDIDTLGLVLIAAKNGFGKTTIRLAIEYLLTDTTSELNDLGEFSFNKEGNCELGCVFQHGDNEIKILKYREHKTYGNKTIFSINNNEEAHTESDRRETQKNINKYFGINKDILGISTIFSQSSPSFPEAKESDRKKIIYDALDLHKYHTYYTAAKNKIEETNTNIHDINIKIEYIKEFIKDIVDETLELENNKKEWIANNKLKIESINKEIKEIETEDFTHIINKLVANKKQAKKDINSINDNIAKLQGLIKPYDSDKHKEYNKEITDIKIKMSRISSEIDRIKEDLDTISNYTCPVLHVFCDKLEENSRDTCQQYNTILKKAEGEYDKLWYTCEELSHELDSIDAIQYCNMDFKESIREEEKRIKSKQDIITNVVSSIKQIEYKIEVKEEKIQECLNRIKEIKSEENPYIKLINDKHKAKDSKKLELDVLKKELKELYEDLKYYKFFKIAFGKSGIPNMRAETFLESVEIATNSILSSISDNLCVSIDSQAQTKSGDVREKVSYKVFSPDKTITDYWSFSGGQRQRVAIADKIAFNSLLGRFSFLFLDEILELSLDENGKQDVIRLLKNKANELDTIFVISHDLGIADSFSNVIEVSMEDGVSRIANRN